MEIQVGGESYALEIQIGERGGSKKFGNPGGRGVLRIGNPDRREGGGGQRSLEIQVGGGLKKFCHPCKGVDFFWNNPIRVFTESQWISRFLGSNAVLTRHSQISLGICRLTCGHLRHWWPKTLHMETFVTCITKKKVVLQQNKYKMTQGTKPYFNDITVTPSTFG